jgi:hypothetical protein
MERVQIRVVGSPLCLVLARHLPVVALDPRDEVLLGDCTLDDGVGPLRVLRVSIYQD